MAEDAIRRFCAYEKGRIQTTEALTATGNAGVIDTNSWE